MPKKRNAKIYARVLGWGISGDAHHMTAPHPEGKGAIISMNMALKDANLSPSDIDYISAHGTATKHNDIIETKAIKEVFKNDAKNIPVSSIKSMIGHTLGASGSMEILALVFDNIL